jgi:hypothetical protein
MSRKLSRTDFATILLLAAGHGSLWVHCAQASETAYPTMAPLARYLETDVVAEIAMARSAAPISISSDATVLVLKSKGYETAALGKNGFVCLVERAWMAPLDGPDFWNPRIRGPICFNPQAARTVLPITIKRTTTVLAGMTKAQMVAAVKLAVERKELPTLEAGAMSYMMSKSGYLGDSVGHWHPHLMFYASRSDGADWGADVPNSPVLLSEQFQGAPEPIATFIVPVPNWSDGTSGGMHKR